MGPPVPDKTWHVYAAKAAQRVATRKIAADPRVVEGVPVAGEEQRCAAYTTGPLYPGDPSTELL